MSGCEFCKRYRELPPIQGDYRFMGGNMDIVDITSLGTGISWRPVGEIDLTFLTLNYCPGCGRKLNEA